MKNEASFKPATNDIATWQKYIESAKDEADLRQRLKELGVAMGKAMYPTDPDAYFVEVPGLSARISTTIDCWACGGAKTRPPWAQSQRPANACRVCNGYGFLLSNSSGEQR